MEKKRIRIIVAYDGTNYHGWQLQENGITIEAELNRCLTELLGEEIRVIGASRTDAGVHALGNIAVFDTVNRMPAGKISYALNQRLPEDIRIQKSEEVPSDWHPRHCASRKTYEYRIYRGIFPMPVKRLYSYFVYTPLDVGRMREAAAYLEGGHDFRSFCQTGAQVESTVRMLYSVWVEEQDSDLVIRVCGNGFLYNMVRIIAGTLIRVGRGFYTPEKVKEILDEQIEQIGDLERIISKVAVGRVSPREVVQLKVALRAIEPIKEACMASDEPSLSRVGEQLNACTEIRDRIEKEINNDPPALLNKGGVIAKGINAELDELRAIAYSGKDYLLKVQQRESEKTGIPSLKIAFNNVFGYYIEVRNAHKDKVPAEWIRKQTLVNAERYITEELKEYEEKILGAEEKILALENRLFTELVTCLAEFIPPIQVNANQIGRLDCLLSFAKVAESNRYIRPNVDDSDVIDIKSGRHPVIEKQLPLGEAYIANDVYLDSEKQQIIIITGPNMAGKSALLRQTALITLMAQIGCFVPAESARIGMVDKIFTRVGASDNISVGESTFMVEMNEASTILNNMSSRSLVLFDELGRGTSTYDGISIAWAIVEYIHEHPNARAKTLFATHYHELNEMERSFKRIKNYNVSVKEVSNKVIFLRKLVPGGSEHSFGIHVAKMAGMPKSIVKRSNEILKQLETDNRQEGIDCKEKAKGKVKAKPVKEIAAAAEGFQLSFFQLDDPVLSQVRDEIKNLDVNNLTPIDALNKLSEIRKIITGK